MPFSEPKAVVSIPAILGEGPIWRMAGSVLYWLDIFRPIITRYGPMAGTDEAIAVGHKVQFIQFSVQRPASGAFGGHSVYTLYVTSATIGLSLNELASTLLSGFLFAIETGISGPPDSRFAFPSSVREVAS